MSSPLNPKLATGIVENFRSDYDTRFTADISKQMQMPDRLGAVDNAYDRFSQPLNHLHDGLLSSHDLSFYMMDAPQVLTLHDQAFSNSGDEGAEGSSEADDPPESYLNENDYQSPRKSDHLEEAAIDVPVTPGSMLLLQNGDEMAVVRRQIAKLTRHVARLQDENNRRRNREFFLYPVIIGYCLVQLVRMMLRTK